MGNRYELFCTDCKVSFDLGSELVWWQDEQKMYCLKDFLLSHTDHVLKVGGDEWNRAFNHDMFAELKQLPHEGYKEFDDEYSIKDLKEERTIK